MLTEYIVPITAVTVCGICFIVKQFTNESQEKFIPLAAGVLGILFNWWVVGSMTPQTFTQGLVSGLGATGMWELLKIPFKVKEATTDGNE